MYQYDINCNVTAFHLFHFFISLDKYTNDSGVLILPLFYEEQSSKQDIYESENVKCIRVKMSTRK